MIGDAAFEALVVDQGMGECGEVGMDARCRHFAQQLVELGGIEPRALAGAHQMRGAADRDAGLQVAQRIADEVRLAEVDAVALADHLEQARQRLSATATVVGAVRAEEDRVDAAAERARARGSCAHGWR